MILAEDVTSVWGHVAVVGDACILVPSSNIKFTSPFKGVEI